MGTSVFTWAKLLQAGGITTETARACPAGHGATALCSPRGAAGPTARQQSYFSNLFVFSLFVCFFFLVSLSITQMLWPSFP